MGIYIFFPVRGVGGDAGLSFDRRSLENWGSWGLRKKVRCWLGGEKLGEVRGLMDWVTG